MVCVCVCEGGGGGGGGGGLKKGRGRLSRIVKFPCYIGNKTIHRQDNSSTRSLETVHRHN